MQMIVEGCGVMFVEYDVNKIITKTTNVSCLSREVFGPWKEQNYKPLSCHVVLSSSVCFHACK